MINPFKETNWRPGVAELNAFARSLVIGFPVLAGLFYSVNWLHSGAMPAPDFYWKLALGGAVVGLLCWLLKPLARPLYVVWYAIACTMGLLVTNLLFVLLYYGLFTAVGLVMRLTGRDPLQLKFDRSNSSYWQDVPVVSDPTQYFRQY
jgi:hypothetical protein